MDFCIIVFGIVLILLKVSSPTLIISKECYHVAIFVCIIFGALRMYFLVGSWDTQQ